MRGLCASLICAVPVPGAFAGETSRKPSYIILFYFRPLCAKLQSNKSNKAGRPKMTGAKEFEVFLDEEAALEPLLRPAAEVVRAIASAAVELSKLIGLGRLYGQLGAARASTNVDGDVQKELDVLANDMFVRALRQAPVGVVVSEEIKEPLLLDPAGKVAVAIDPLDGSSNIDTNLSIGTIFSILPMLEGRQRADAHVLQPGQVQLAAGFVIYGPQTTIVFALGEGKTQILTLDRHDDRFYLALSSPAIPKTSAEYAINASNYRHWEEPVRAFIDDCVQGAQGRLKSDHNMRWTGSLVADAYRILMRGGIFLYPGDQRPGYGRGRLRLLYEANPVAFVIERAGGAATDGVQRILDVMPSAVHERVPLVFGSAAQVELVARYHSDPQFTDRAPLFGNRGLIRH